MCFFFHSFVSFCAFLSSGHRIMILAWYVVILNIKYNAPAKRIFKQKKKRISCLLQPNAFNIIKCCCCSVAAVVDASKATRSFPFSVHILVIPWDLPNSQKIIFSSQTTHITICMWIISIQSQCNRFPSHSQPTSTNYIYTKWNSLRIQ